MTYFIAMTLARLLSLLLLALPALCAAEPPTVRPVPLVTLIADAENAIRAGDDRTAESMLSRIPSGSLDALQLGRVQIVRAEIGLRRAQPDTALRSLPARSAHLPTLAPRMELLRGRAQFMAGDPVAAVRTLVAREQKLNQAREIADNQDQIWNGLIAAPLSASALASIDREDPLTRGWLELARVLQQGPTPAAVAGWSQRHPGHPGGGKAALVQSNGISVARTPIPLGPGAPGIVAPAGPATPSVPAPTLAFNGGYALLLPTSGTLATAGRAVREGFISAWFDLPEPRPAIRIYDPGNNATTAIAAYQSALREGAGFIVGPLTKEGVSAIASQGVSLPWLTLNYVDGPAGNAIQFGLAPEDEARAAATSAIARGHRNALALAPANDWGERAVAAFSASFTEQGGRLLQSARYAAGTQDFGKPLRELLKLSGSAQRHQTLTATLGVPSEFEPRPREDAEVLFVPLRASEARSLLPQMKFFRTQKLATYTLSAAHTGSLDARLDGVWVCDMPWVLDGAGNWARAREAARLRFPEVLREQPRLFALGVDALQLVRGLSRGEVGGGRELVGASGRLGLKPGNRIERRLECLAIRDGRSVSGS